jgi:hypothetical protein
MKRRIAMIQPYFGTLPNYFDLALKSYAYNADFDWYLFTDDRRPFDYPPNVIVTYITLEQLKERFQAHFGFPITLERPYKLCDYRPMYGHLFADYLKGYDFWGHFDPDVIFGDIKKYVTEELCQLYDRLYLKGHFSLYRNIPVVNLLYREKVANCVYYKDVITRKNSWCFDERGDAMNTFFAARNLKVYDGSPVADIYFGDYAMKLVSEAKGGGEKFQRSCFAYERGGVYRYYWLEDEIHREEFMYLHLMKRRMDVQCSNPCSYLIYGNAFRESQPVTKSLLESANENRIFYRFWSRRKFVRFTRTAWRILFVERDYLKLTSRFLGKCRAVLGSWRNTQLRILP